MRNAILIHGWGTKEEFYDSSKPTASNSHWFPWLSKQLMIRDIHTVAIEMPRSFYPNYEDWKRELERFDITHETVLVGHSCGSGFLVRWLSENTSRVGRVVLVAPWLGDGPDRDFDSSFFDFNLDKNIAAKTERLSVLYSKNDNEQIQIGADKLRGLPSINTIAFEDKGHFCIDDLGGEEFPELLKEIVG